MVMMKTKKGWVCVRSLIGNNYRIVGRDYSDGELQKFKVKIPLFEISPTAGQPYYEGYKFSDEEIHRLANEWKQVLEQQALEETALRGKQ
jgi:hypothetical protein